MKIRNGLSVLLFSLLSFFICIIITTLPVGACTLWASTGKAVKDGGTILAKNRDWGAKNVTLVKFRKKEGKLSYYGIFGEKKGKSTGVKAGINEKGLAIASASVSTLPKKDRKYPPGSKKLSMNKYILSNFGSVDEVLKNQQIFAQCSPTFYIIGDKNKIAEIEIAPGGKYSIKTRENGSFAHSNQYSQNSEFLKFNKRKNTSSASRLKRISALTGEKNAPFSFEDYIKISKNTDDGADNSIWRTGSSPKKSRTLASFIVRIPKEGYPKIYMRIADYNKKIKEYHLDLDESFWE